MQEELIASAVVDSPVDELDNAQSLVSELLDDGGSPGGESFRIIRQISAGRDAVAYEAVDTRNGETVELRRFSASCVGDADRWSMLSARLHVLEHLDHPAALRLREFTEDGDSPFLIVDPLPALRLCEALEGIEPDVLFAAVCEIVGAVAAAHRLSLFHGNLSTQTVYLADGAVRLDFTGVRARPFDIVAPPDSSDAKNDIHQLAILLDALLKRDKLRAFVREQSARLTAGLDQLIARSLGGDEFEYPTAAEFDDVFQQLIRFAGDGLSSAPAGGEGTQEVDMEAELAEAASDSTAECRVDPKALAEAAASLNSRRISPGDRIGRYHIESRLGEGGMGTVFKAIDIGTRKPVAVKILKDNKRFRRFEKEARLLSAVNNPHITNLIEVNEDAGWHYIVVEFVDGTDLKQLLAERSPLPERDALNIASDIARALVDAHSLGIVHRDIKPDNVLMTEADIGNGRYRAKLSDFGIARFIDQTESMEVTQAGTLLGTPVYMSPEQCRAEGEVGPGTDVYSLGITLFEMLTGKRPFESDDPMVLAAMHCFDAPPCVRKLNPAISEPLAAIVAKALAKSPEDRYADAAHLLRELSRLSNGDATNVVQHPILPEHDPSRLFESDFEWVMDSPPELLWPYVSNTERLNRAVGLPSVKYETQIDPERGVRKFGSFRLGGVAIRWEEHPFEWIEGKRMGILREFAGGPFLWFLSIVELESRPGGGSVLHHRVRIAPRNLLGRFLAKVEVDWKGKRSLDRVYGRIDQVMSGKIAREPGVDPFETPGSLNGSRRTRLRQRLDRLVDEGVDPDLAGLLGEYLTTAPAQEVARIRPFALADQLKQDRQRVLEACLLAESAGLLSLHWDILCPTCRVAADTKSTLKELQQHTFCEACNTDFESDLANSIELIFRVQSDLREADTGKYCIGGPEHAPHVVAQLRLRPAERMELELSLPAGDYVLRGPQLPRAIDLRVRTTGVPSQAEVTLAPGADLQTAVSVRAGKQVLHLNNEYEQLKLVRIERTIPRDDVVTAATAASQPMFRRLFPHEVLESGRLVSAEQIVLLVTRITDIERLYRDRGDAAAYAVIDEHFQLLERDLATRNGAVVKRFGEGLVAAFDDVEDAVATAVALRRALRAGESTAGLNLSAGVHRGPVLVINANDRLDYFGETMRFAATLPEAVESGVVLSEAVFGDPAIAETLSNGERSSAVRTIDRPDGSRPIVQTFEFE